MYPYIEVIVGTYEEFVLGYMLKKSDTEIGLSQSFATHAHTGSVRSVAVGGRYLASGGADDKVIIHDLKSRTEIRVMMHHNGTVNTVSFSQSGSHLFTGSTDGSITVTRTGNWQMEKHWKKAHNGNAVHHIAIHPSDKLALTLGGDNILRTWNLIKGRHAYATNLSSKGVAQATSVVWSPKGEQFAMVGLEHIDIWTILDAGIKKKLHCAAKCVCLAWLSENCIAAGLESGEIQLFYLKSSKVKTFKAHEQRVKVMTYIDKYIISASSSGHIKVWEYNKPEKSITELCVASTGCRITSIALNKLVYSDSKPVIEDNTNVAQTTQKEKRKHDSNNICKSYVTVTAAGNSDDEEFDEDIPKVSKSRKLNKVAKKRKQKKIKLQIDGD